LSSNFSRDLIGGDIGGLAALATRLQSYPPQIGNVVGALNHQVERLVHDAGWWGDAADAFKRRWEVDANGAQALADVVALVAGVISVLATNLRNVEDALEQAAGDARAAGVPVGPGGQPPVLTAGATPAVQAAAATYEQEWQVAQDLALRARMDANKQLMDIEGQIGPQANGDGSQLRADQWVTDADYLRGFWAIPAAARLSVQQKLPKLWAERKAAHARFTQAVKVYSRQHLKTPDYIKADRRLTLERFQNASAELDKLDELVKKVPLAKRLDVRVGSLLKLAPGLADESRMLKFLGDIPVIDVAAAVAGTALQSYDDMQKGEDWTAIPKELTANVGGIVAGVAAGVAVGAVVVAGAALIGVSAPAILVIGAGAIVGGAVAVGVGDAITNVWHEHWDEDIHKYGVVGGIGSGLANVGTNTVHDMGKLATSTGQAISGAASSLWHGIFG
jgi:uncharacterized protein YukE